MKFGPGEMNEDWPCVCDGHITLHICGGFQRYTSKNKAHWMLSGLEDRCLKPVRMRQKYFAKTFSAVGLSGFIVRGHHLALKVSFSPSSLWLRLELAL